jgi:cation diffusion facilitator CzcD-associated flavoprotein CzcO
MDTRTTTAETPRDAAAKEPQGRYDAIVIGAGIAGLYQLHRLRQLGLSVRVFEAGGGVGGTWYWNRYPGARFDSESYTYGYSFSEELLQEWEWSEHFAPQPETLRYVNLVADKFDLRRHVEFNKRVVAANFDADANLWEVEAADGRRAKARFLITAIGLFATPTMPRYEGLDSFRGLSVHTGNWPHEPVDFRGKRVAVIGTGATGVQVIQEVAKTAGHLTVFQRTPNYCAPLGNRPIDAKTQLEIKATYPEIFARCRESHGCFVHKVDPRKTFEVSPEEREAFFDRLYTDPGFGLWMGNFKDILVDPAANATVTDFVHRKIRERVRDPEVAEKLIPRNHGFGTRRIPLETSYYEVYNQDNVRLVDLTETPIARISPHGIVTTAGEQPFDIIIYATGFHAVLGGFEAIAFRGLGGKTLKDKWADGPRTFLGMQVEGFPNLFTLVGPHNAATFCNIPRCIEQNVDWVTDLIAHMQTSKRVRVSPLPQAESEWTAHVHDMASTLLYSTVDSWLTGVNSNLPEKRERRVLLYAGGAPRYRKRCDEVAAQGYREFEFR